MDHIGIDGHKRDSQIYILAEGGEIVEQRVRGLPLPGRLLSVVAPLLALMRPLNRQLSYSDATIEHLAVQDPRVPRLRSVPSIGPVTAAAFHRRDRRRPTLPPRASARSLPRPRAPRV